MRLLAWLFVGCCAAVLPCGGSAQPHSGSITVNGRAIPLPPGQWAVGGTHSNVDAVTRLGYRSVILMQEQGGRLTAVVVIGASDRGDVRFYPSAERLDACQNTPATIAMLVREPNQTAPYCARVASWPGNQPRPPNATPEFAAMFDRRDANPGWVAERYHSVRIYYGDSSGAVWVAYDFSPEARGFPYAARPGAADPWNPSSQTLAQRDYLVRLIAWGNIAREGVRRGFLFGRSEPLPPF